MKKIILALSIVAGSFGAVQAQDGGNEGFHFAGGLRLAMPIGDFSDVAGFGFGAELQGEYGFAEKVTGLISAGYTTFSGKDFTIGGQTFEGSSSGFIPVLAGVRFYPSSQFFLGGKAGISFSTASGGGSAFTYEPQVGYNGEKFQVSLGYNAMSKSGVTLGSIGASFLYKFN